MRAAIDLGAACSTVAGSWAGSLVVWLLGPQFERQRRAPPNATARIMARGLRLAAAPGLLVSSFMAAIVTEQRVVPSPVSAAGSEDFA